MPTKKKPKRAARRNRGLPGQQSRHTEMLAVRVSSSLLAELAAAATHKGQPASAYVRAAILAALKRDGRTLSE